MLIALISYSSVLVNLIVTPVELWGVVPCTALFIHGKGHHKGTEKITNKEISLSGSVVIIAHQMSLFQP